jgi:hypothetical protein
MKQSLHPQATLPACTPCLAPLTSLTQLCQLVVKGMIPALNSGETFLPASLTKLVLDFEGMQMCDDFESERVMVQAWLSWGCGPVQPNLQHLQLMGLTPCFKDYIKVLDFSRLPGLKELRFMPSLPEDGAGCDPSWGVCRIPTSITQLSKLEVLQLVVPQTRYPFHGCVPHFALPAYGGSTEFLSTCTRLRSLGYVMGMIG